MLIRMLRNYLFLLIPVMLAGIVYSNSLKNSFVWDDNIYILNNPLVKSWGGVVHMFKPEYWKSEHKGMKGLYRPLRNVSFTIDYSLWHLNPFGYHLTNVLLHMAVAGLVAFAARRIFNSNIAGLAAGVLFAVHPMHIENVNYIKNRSDILCGMFMILSFLFWLKKRNGLSAASLVISILSKETGAMAPLLFVFSVPLLFEKNEWKNRFISLWPHIFIFGCFLFWKFGVLIPYQNEITISEDPVINGVGPVRLIVSTFANYLSLIFVPANLMLDRQLHVFNSLFEIKAILFYLITTAGIWLLLQSKNSFKYLFAILWILLTLAPVSNIIPIKGRALAEQRLYIPSIGWAILLGGLAAYFLSISKPLMQNMPKVTIKNVTAVILVFITAVSSIFIMKRNKIWRDPITLWKTTIKENPYNSRAWLSLAGLELEKGNIKETERICNMIIENSKGKISEAVCMYMGIISQIKGSYDEAIKWFKKGLEIKPADYEFLGNLGSVYLIKGQLEEAENAYLEALKSEPGGFTAGIYANLGIIALRKGEYKKAENNLKKAVELNPDLIEARLNLAQLYNSMGMKYEAQWLEREADLRMKTGSKIPVYSPKMVLE